MYTSNNMANSFVFAMALIALYDTWLMCRIYTSSIPMVFMKTLSLFYIFQCAFRSIFVSNYVTQTTTTNNPLNSPLLARLFAFIGETCFIIQLGYYFNKNYESNFLFSFLVCSNLYAQIVSTIGTCTKIIGNFVIEGILWLQIFATLYVWSMFIYIEDDSKSLFVKSAVACMCLCIYMATVYIPYTVEQRRTMNYQVDMTIVEKIKHAFFFKNVNTSWEEWKNEALWQMPYFLLGPAVSATLCFLS